MIALATRRCPEKTACREAPIRDARRHLVPPNLERVFFARKKSVQFCRELEELIDKLVVMRHSSRLLARHRGEFYLDWMVHVDIKKITDMIRAVAMEVQAGTPIALCPCRSNSTACPDCGGNGWLTGRQYNEQLSRIVKSSS